MNIPVRIEENGRVEYRLNGKFHRKDGPAVEYADGTKFWYLNGKLHREDGPAIERADGTKLWYLNGTYLTEKEFNLKVEHKKPYLRKKIVRLVYNKDYGDDRVCKCGHLYYRHFDTYDNMSNVGCKYCQCYRFREKGEA